MTLFPDTMLYRRIVRVLTTTRDRIKTGVISDSTEQLNELIDFLQDEVRKEESRWYYGSSPNLDRILFSPYTTAGTVTVPVPVPAYPPAIGLEHEWGPDKVHKYGMEKNPSIFRVCLWCHRSNVYLRSIGEECSICQ